MSDTTKARHRDMLGTKHVDWPAGGPGKWLTEWENLMTDCEIWCPALYNDWASDFNLVWGEVPDAKWLCNRLVEAKRNEELDLWDIYRASRELQQAWEEKSIRNGMKVARKGRASRAAFNVEPRFDGAGPPEDPESNPEQASNPTTPTAQSSRKRSGTETTQKAGAKRGQKKSKKPCWGCGGTHPPFKCVLISAHNPREIQVPAECRRTFEEKLKDPSFAKKIRTIREACEIKRELAAANAED